MHLSSTSLCVIPPDDSAPTDAMLDGAANANANALPDIPTNATAFLDSPTNANAFPDSNTNANVDEAADL